VRGLPAAVWRRRAELRHGLRIAAAGLLSFALAYALALPQGYWAVFTAVLVVQGSVGGSWKAAVDRLAGTVLGAVYGAFIAVLVPHETAVMLGVALAISLTPLAILAALIPSYRVAPITAVILLLGNAGVTEGPFLAAILRTIEVALGGLVGMAVSLLLYPARAHTLLGNAANRVLQHLAELFSQLIDALLAASDASAVLAKQDAVRAALSALETVSDEAARERRNYLTEDTDPEPVARTLRRVRHDVILIGRIAAEPLPAEILARLRPLLMELSAAAAEFLRLIGRSFADRAPPPSPERFESDVARVVAELETIKGSDRLVTLSFALEQLQRNLRDLERRAEEFSRSPAKTPRPSKI